MHIPDGFINGTTAAGAGVVAAGGLGVALRQASAYLQERRLPFAGLVGAMVFALQMLNFPIAAGTSGHVLGGAVAAILLGPSLGIVAVSVVVIVQALLFADGGLTALGLNIVNMAAITALVGWFVFRLVRAVTPGTQASVVGATFIAGLVSVVASALGFVAQYALGGAGGAPLDAVFAAMSSIHVLIGIGEGLVSAALVGAVLATRPDLVFGARGVAPVPARPARLGFAAFMAAGVGVALALVFLVAPFAADDPDGLERVAIDQGFDVTATPRAAAGSPLSDYGVSGVANETLGTGMSGAVGASVVLAVGIGGLWLVSRHRRRAADLHK